MSKKINFVGVIIGIAIMVCSYFVFSFDTSIKNPDFSDVSLSYIPGPEEESNEYYGGDAYTGIQQAAAQAANNLIPVFDAIEDNGYAIRTLNDNNVKIAKTEIKNAETIVSTIKYCVGFIMLSVGLAVISKSVVFEISIAKKVKEAPETETIE